MVSAPACRGRNRLYIQPRVTGQAYRRLQVIRTVQVDNITQLGKVTVTLVRLENCIHQSKLQGLLKGQWKMQ